MKDIEKAASFGNLYAAFRAARLGKRATKEEIVFEADLSRNLIMLSDGLKRGTYRISGYYSFMIHDPKDRKIHALHFADRVVQHSLCDNVLSDVIEKHLIYENAACRIRKGTDFARRLLTRNLRSCFNEHGRDIWVLKCDIRKYFDSVDHAVLKRLLRRIIYEPEMLNLLDMIIDSYHTSPGKGIPMGNQTSQWFALYYLDGLDRLFKERLGLTGYVRYMDDIVIVSHDKQRLTDALKAAREYIAAIGLDFNSKTQVFPVKNGVSFLGWRYSLTESGKVTRRVSSVAKKRFINAVRTINDAYNSGQMSWAEAESVLRSYCAYLDRGDTRALKQKAVSSLVLLGSW